MEIVLRYLLLGFIMSLVFAGLVCTLPSELFGTSFFFGIFIYALVKNSWGYMFAAFVFKSLYFDHIYQKKNGDLIVGVLFSVSICSMIVFFASMTGYFNITPTFSIMLFLSVLVNMYIGHLLINRMYHIPESE
jgi:hypothetical protein